jgi:GNAT superfamily N-acetyltransferase
MPDGSVEVRALAPDEYAAAVPGLARLLVDAVEGGASVNFLAGLTLEAAAGWWRARETAVADGTIGVLVAEAVEEPEPGGVPSAIVGCTILLRSRNPNAPHRAEVGKVLVDRAWRRRGLGRRLMAAVEALARADGRWLLHLDVTAGTAAERLYRAAGWTELGTMPDHSMLPDGTLAPTIFFWKDLRAS